MADPRDALEAGARQYLASLSDAQFNQLVAETREPQNPDDTPNQPDPAPGGARSTTKRGLASGRAMYAKDKGGGGRGFEIENTREHWIEF